MKIEELLLIPPNQAVESLQTGLITLHEACILAVYERYPYDILFTHLPFDKALDMSIKYAQNEVRVSVENSDRMRWLEEGMLFYP
jgi:hypothetical protein